jgi:O-antigen/teichoic acid export membrane protein
MFLGIYYNLSIWYKISNKTMAGATITLIGAAITIIINFCFIPYFSYMACAWATFTCYGSMMVISFIWGQKEYRIPYAWKKLTAYLVIVVLIFFFHKGLIAVYENTVLNLTEATILLFAFIAFVARIEKHELKKLPFISR